jgi:cystathionine beta-lyase/cystathionine gamma-synthase
MSNRPVPAFSTRAVHAGERLPQGKFTPVSSAIQPSVGYLYESMDDVDEIFGGTQDGYVYARYGSPSVTAFETAVASLEGAEAAYGFASGMAALHVALLAAGVNAGKTVVTALDVYGATYNLVRKLFASLGAEARMVDGCDLKAVEAALAETHPAALLVETVSNPLLKVADVPAVADLAHRYGAQLLVDNTFATPYLYRPIASGADYVIHSATKYLGGHGDVLAGVIATSQANRLKLFELNKMVGSVLGPFDAWLALRGLKTLPLRMQRQCANAAVVAEMLRSHPRIARVNYPGLPDHPQHALASRLFSGLGYGGMLSFEIARAGKAEVFRFFEALELCLPVTTLGDIYTLVLHPATSSHRGLTPAERAEVGIPDGLVRLSAGIEAPEDILADLQAAMEVL